MSKLSLVQRSLLPAGQWDTFVENHPSGWWFHREAWIDYSLAYAPGSVDTSNAIVLNGDVEPTVLGVVAGVTGQTFGGQALPAPLFSDALDFQATGPYMPLTWRPGECPKGGVPDGHRIVERGTYVVDLRKDESILWRNMRKSYKSLIRKAERTYDLDVFSGSHGAGWRMQRAKSLHILAAQRQTRSDETWALQADWLRSGNGVLVLAHKDNDPRGFAYAIRWKHWSYYASGATLDENLSHALIWHLMRTMRSDGQTQWFEVGHEAELGETKKAHDIAFFKSGFGGDRWPVRMLVPQMVS